MSGLDAAMSTKTLLYSSSTGIGSGDIYLSQKPRNFDLMMTVAANDGDDYHNSYMWDPIAMDNAWNKSGSNKIYSIWGSDGDKWDCRAGSAGSNTTLLDFYSDNGQIYQIYGIKL